MKIVFFDFNDKVINALQKENKKYNNEKYNIIFENNKKINKCLFSIFIYKLLCILLLNIKVF